MKVARNADVQPFAHNRLPQQLIQWLSSNECKKDLAEIINHPAAEIRKLDAVRRVKPEDLHVPVTL